MASWSVTRAESSEQLVLYSTECLSPIPQGLPLKRHRQSLHHQFVFSSHDNLSFDDFFDDLSSLPSSEKKKRLTADQVQFLETSFSSDIKLEPERKADIAKKLGLRPRQVAIWFQNRRVRWKNKQLEQEYEDLKVKYEMLSKENSSMMKKSEAVLLENNQLQAEVAHLRDLLQMSTKHTVRAIATDLVNGMSLPGFDSDCESGSKELTSTKSSEDPADIKDSEHSSAASEEIVVDQVYDDEEKSDSFIMCTTTMKLDYDHHHHTSLLFDMEDHHAANIENHFSFFLDEQALGLVWSS